MATEIVFLTGDPSAVEAVVTLLEERGVAPAVRCGIPRVAGGDGRRVVVVHGSVLDVADGASLAAYVQAVQRATRDQSPVLAVDESPMRHDRLFAALASAAPGGPPGWLRVAPAAPRALGEAIGTAAQCTGGVDRRTIGSGKQPAAAGETGAAAAVMPGWVPADRGAPVPRDTPVVDTGRLRRAVLTVVAVSAVLWVLFRSDVLLDRREPVGRANTPIAGAPQVMAVASTAEPSPARATGGELAGRVTRGDTNGSIGGATVVATGPSGSMATVTDGQGNWRFTGLRGGTYVVVSTVPRFVARQVQVVVPEGGAMENVHLRLDPEG